MFLKHVESCFTSIIMKTRNFGFFSALCRKKFLLAGAGDTRSTKTIKSWWRRCGRKDETYSSSMDVSPRTRKRNAEMAPNEIIIRNIAIDFQFLAKKSIFFYFGVKKKRFFFDLGWKQNWFPEQKVDCFSRFFRKHSILFFSILAKNATLFFY